MKAAWRFVGASSLVWAASFASATTLESALHGGDPAEHSALMADGQVLGTAYGASCTEGCDDSCDEQCADACGDLCNTCCLPTWKVRAGAVILTRDNPDEVVLARPMGGLIQISGGEDFNFGHAGGPDISLERALDNGPNSIEFRYFGGLEWTSEADYGVTGDIQIGPINLPLAIDVTADYLSRLNSTEFNFRHQHSDRVTWLTGFRIIELHEELSYDVDFVVPNLSGVSWNTDNHLWGTQVGADLQLWRLGGPLSVNGIFKAGVYGNNSDNDFTFDVLGTPIVEGTADDNRVAFVGEIGVTTAYQLTEHFALRGGYQLLWIDQVTLASNQAQVMLDTLDVNAINASGDVFYHGALVGGEFTW
jgi:hypothetical protein